MATILDTLADLGGRVIDSARDTAIAKLQQPPPPPAPTDEPKLPDPAPKSLPPEQKPVPVNDPKLGPSFTVSPMLAIVALVAVLGGSYILATRLGKKG